VLEQEAHKFNLGIGAFNNPETGKRATSVYAVDKVPECPRAYAFTIDVT